jgi:DNA-binding FadR family transcriptional regulator
VSAGAEKTVRQHIAIVKALDSGDPGRAAQAMEEHLAYVLRYSSGFSDDATRSSTSPTEAPDVR